MATKEALGKTEQINGRRYYNVEEGTQYPSVTTILGAFADQSGLDKWRKRVGEAEANRISKFSANRGTVMHQLCEYYILSEKPTPKEKREEALEKIVSFVEEESFTEDETRVGKSLFLNFYNCGLFDRIHSVISVEEMLYSHQMGGYAGRVDNIYGDAEGRPVILDFKSANKPKKRDWIDNYYEQISAYYLAYWEMHGVKPKGGEIWISNEYDGVPQIFEVTVNDIKNYGKLFLSKVKRFHQEFCDIPPF